MLLVLSGFPGTGKSTLARELARRLGAAYLRVDSVESALLNAGHRKITVEGYAATYIVAADNLMLGLSVVADCVNPVRETREAWEAVAQRAGVELVNVEVVCSNAAEHRRRVEARHADVSSGDGRWAPPNWDTVEASKRDYQPWPVPVLRVDTALGQVEEWAEKLTRSFLHR